MRRNTGKSFLLSLLSLVVTWGGAGIARAEDKPGVPVELRPLPGGRLVYLETDGPYWEAGPTIAKVQDLMTAQKQTGPIHVRYAGDPSAESGSARKAKIGFIANGDWAIENPFREEKLEPAQAAGLLIEGLQGSAVQSIPAIKTWIQTQGLEPSGPVVELINGLGDAKKPAKSELLMLVRQPKTATPDAKSNAVAETSSSGDLWEKKDYKGIAERLIPDKPAPSKETQIWLGQIVYRVGAVAKGVSMMYPDQAADTTVLTDALMDRLTRVAPNAMSEAKKQAITRTDFRPDSIEGQRSRLVRALDTLLYKVSSKSKTPTEVASEVRRILGLAENLILETPP